MRPRYTYTPSPSETFVQRVGSWDVWQIPGLTSADRLLTFVRPRDTVTISFVEDKNMNKMKVISVDLDDVEIVSPHAHDAEIMAWLTLKYGPTHVRG